MPAIDNAEVERRIADALQEAKNVYRRLPEAQNDAARLEAISKLKITKFDKQVATVLDVVRPLEWKLENGQPVERPIKDREAVTAALLYRRGEEVERCDRCQTLGPFAKCIISPSLGGRALHRAACANCIFYHQGTYCPHRLKFEKSKGEMWAESDTQLVLPNGGLRQTLALTGETGFGFLRVNDEDSTSKAQESGESSAPNNSSPAHQSEEFAPSGITPSSEEQDNLPTSPNNSNDNEDEARVDPSAMAEGSTLADDMVTMPQSSATQVDQYLWPYPPADTLAGGLSYQFFFSQDMPEDDSYILPQLSATQAEEELCPYPPAGDCFLAQVPEHAEYSIEHEPQENKQE
ncbi:DUF3716 domain-containing protein [Aspergillus luchuensis]|uniref:Uncharacterized protein n=2 Tax=Aspergillus kawachii TaxID=1069201 RepID=A0A1M3TE09_ASPLC|nr:uncharacterized protein AKAW2_60814S [Aspergillus luchuensis]OJZ84979.1 hypothetical protein ASPFODRAFT_61671 [Aspergillus luchuensis CBS 106.47]GAA86436.1 similar to An12g04040 [Aspergillus luchuensis IFO 4308]BCS02550.1 hypothetical protein AKAW2_60814S [Aspergillus luchuensis]BCS14223.1 hypothetical protein ALUC_60779S [Aspergillus luchuensis]GAT30285.1 similar to An12g04040 [Aspergillus luchuensis]